MCEQKEVTKITTVQTALFTVFSLYYCLHLQYPDEAKWIYYFFQDFILQQPDRSTKSATYIGHKASIAINQRKLTYFLCNYLTVDDLYTHAKLHNMIYILIASI